VEKYMEVENGTQGKIEKKREKQEKVAAGAANT